MLIGLEHRSLHGSKIKILLNGYHMHAATDYKSV